MNENSRQNHPADLSEERIEAYQNKLESLYKEQFRILSSDRLRAEEARNSLEEKHAELYERYILLVHESADSKIACNRVKDLLQAREEKLTGLQKELDAARTERREALEKCAAVEKQLVAQKAALTETAARLAAEEQKFLAEQDRLQKELAASRSAAEDAGEKLTAAEKRLEAQKATLAETAARLAADERKFLTEQTRLQEELTASRSAAEDAGEKLTAAEKRLEAQKAALTETAARLAAEEQKFLTEQDRLQKELTASRSAAEDAGEKLTAAEKRLEDQKNALAAAEARHAAEEQKFLAEQSRLQKELTASRSAAEDAGEKLTAAEARHAAEEQKFLAEQARLQEELQTAQATLNARIPAERYRLLKEELEHLQEEQGLRDRQNSRTIAALQGRIERMENWTSLKIGRAITRAGGSFRGFLSLPNALYHIWKDVREDRAVQRELLSDANLRQLLETQGGRAVLQRIAGTRLSSGKKAALAARLAKECHKRDLTSALTLMEGSLSFRENDACRKWYAFRNFDAGNIRKSCALLAGIDGSLRFSASEKNKKRFMEGCLRLLEETPAIPAVPLKPAGNNRKIIYVASSSIVYQTTGYTVRTHNLLRELVSRGMDILCVTRPGYPKDRNDLPAATGVQRQCAVDGVTYMMLEGPHRRKEPLDVYLARSADILRELFAGMEPAIVHAASNYETALPACMAAGSLGIPFIYEVRGLWEYTAASRIAHWEGSERFQLDRQLETLVTLHADAVCTLNDALREEIMRRANLSTRPFLLPNAIPDDSGPAEEKSAQLLARWNLSRKDFIVGYAGSVVGYEGLDVLLKAVPELTKAIPTLKVVIIGTGNALDALRALAAGLGITDRVIFAGTVPHEEISRCCSMFDAAVLPRADYAVCRLVSPLKLYEYMSYGLPVVISDVRAMREMVEPEHNALVFPAGDEHALAACLIRLHDNPELRASLRTAALETARRHTWSKSTDALLACYDAFFNGSTSRKTRTPAIDTRPATPEQDDAPAEVPVLPCADGKLTAEDRKSLREKLETCLSRGGIPLLTAFLARQDAVCQRRIQAICRLTAADILLAAGFEAQALACAEQGVGLDAGVGALRSFAKLLYDAALFDRAADVAGKLQERFGSQISSRDAAFLARIQKTASLVRDAGTAGARCDFERRPGVVLNILAFSLPYTSVGYATRSHGLAGGIRHAGWDIIPHTRPGFPGDFKKDLADASLPPSDTLDGLTYHRIFSPSRNNMSEEEYLRACADTWEEVIRRIRPSVVHAASNYVTALPALIAARKQGVPFVYEVRGFWEVTRTSRDDGFTHTPKYRHMTFFEQLVCEQADAVITITTPMKEELIRRGLPEEKIAVAFNSVDVERFVPVPRDEALAERLGIAADCPVIGYVGSMVDYEGLEDLLTAAAALKREGQNFRLLLVGDGACSEALRRQAEELELTDIAIMPGRVPHEQVESFYSLVDIAPFPRKPWEVCELVSPLKPFEAMAQQKAVVVSSTAALREIVRHGKTGMIFEKGDVASLRDTLRTLLLDAPLREELGRNARNWVARERTWNQAGKVCVRTYENIN